MDRSKCEVTFCNFSDLASLHQKLNPMYKPISTGLICLVLQIFSYSLFAQTTSDLEDLVDSLCSSWTADAPGGVVGVVEDGALTFSKAYGLASLEYEVPITTNSIFNIASVSKQFTAYALVLLEQEGKLSLDDDVRKHLPELPDFGETITIRHLLTHTSGLRNFQNLLSMAGWRQGDAMTNEDLLRFISQQKELNFPVGSEYLYCNSGFVLSTFIVERVTGQDFKEWTQENIFAPLEMGDTEYREDLTEIHINTATSYDHTQSNGFVQPHKYWTYMGNGNVYTTLADLTKWINNFRTKLLGGEAGIRTLTTPGILNSGDTLDYALGLGVATYQDHLRWSHGGSVGGYRSAFQYYPDRDLGIVVLANHSNANPGGKANFIARHFLSSDATETYAAPRKKYQHVKEAVKINADTRNKFIGSYYVRGVVVDIFEKNGELFFTAEGVVSQMMVKPASDTSFFVPIAPITIFFPTDNPDIVILRNDQVMEGEKMVGDASHFTSLEGTYYSEELETRYEILLRDDRLVGYHQRHGEFELYPLEEDRLKSSAFYFADVKVVYRDENDVEGIKVSNGRVRNVWFEKIE